MEMEKQLLKDLGSLGFTKPVDRYFLAFEMLERLPRTDVRIGMDEGNFMIGVSGYNRKRKMTKVFIIYDFKEDELRGGMIFFGKTGGQSCYEHYLDIEGFISEWPIEDYDTAGDLDVKHVSENVLLFYVLCLAIIDAS